MEERFGKVYGYTVYVEEGKVTMALDKDGYAKYPYIASNQGGWDLASRELSVSALRQRMARGTAVLR